MLRVHQGFGRKWAILSDLPQTHWEPWAGTRKPIPVAQTPRSGSCFWNATACSLLDYWVVHIKLPTSRVQWRNPYFRQKEPWQIRSQLQFFMFIFTILL